MAHKEGDKVVRDADEVIRDYYEGEETESQGRLPDLQESLPREDDFGQERGGSTARSAMRTGGDMDEGWEYGEEEDVEESNHTPEQDIVDDRGKAVGVTFQATEPLQFDEKLEKRDRVRWELDPASSEDYQERLERGDETPAPNDPHQKRK